MLNLATAQQAIVDSPVKTASWLFFVTDRYLNTYHWSTKNVTAIGGNVEWAIGIAWDAGIVWTDGYETDYAFKIVDFYGLELARPRTESGIMAPNTLSFSAVNKDHVYDPEDFEGGSILLTLMMSDGTGIEEEIAAWKFLIKKVGGQYQQLDFTCEDFLQQYLDGAYPGLQYRMTGDAVVWASGIVWDTGIVWPDGTSDAGQTYGLTVHDIFFDTSGVSDFSDNVCIPLPFGTCYVPVRPAYIADGYYYILGPTTANGVPVTYTIEKVRTPREYSAKSEYAATFTQSTKISDDGYSFRVFQAALADPPTNGLFNLGDYYYDLPTKFTRSDTASLTDFADVIEYALLDMGVDPLDIDASSFATAKAIHTGWGLACNGAFWKGLSREAALLSLLSQCHSTLVIGDKIELHVLDSTSRKTLTAADFVRDYETGPGSFRHTRLERTLYDCGNAKFSPTDDAQDKYVYALVAALSTKRNISDTPLELPFIQDGTIARQLGRLFFQRQLLKKAEQRFTAKGTCIALQPSDFVTITGDNYGGQHDVMIDSMTIKKDLSIDFVCTQFTAAIENYS